MLHSLTFISAVVLAIINAVTTQECPNGVNRMNCDNLPNFCQGQQCLRYPTAECYKEECEACRPKFRLNDVALTGWDCKVAVPDRKCPPPPPPRNCQASGKDGCKENSDCQADQICCKDGCLHVCIKRPNTATEKGGTCPIPTSGSCENQCQNDAQCYGKKKCCSNSCGKMCMDPIPETSETCPDGSKPIACPPLCSLVTCQAFPNAQCTEISCGGCNVEFKDNSGAKVDCNYLGPEDCSTCVINPCHDTKCAAFPTAECRPKWCPDCEAQFYVGDQVVNCDACIDGSAPLTCPDTCAAWDCPNHATAECRVNRCNSCKPEWFINNNKIRNVDCIKREPCSAGSILAKCRGDCLGRTCPGVPDAECIVNGCGGCTAIFYNSNRESLSPQQCGVCSDWSLPSVCETDPCAEGCAAHPEADCSVNVCGGCSAEYTVNGNPVDCTIQFCTKPDGSQGSPVQCFINPCDLAQCPVYPDAICRPNFCGECSAHFYVNNRVVDCTTCPSGSAPAKCAQDLCSTKDCPGRSLATCRVNVCDNCEIEFFVDGNKIPDVDCIKQDTCPPNTHMETCAGQCLGQTCPARPEAGCLINGCGGCKVKFYDKNRQELSAQQCGVCPDWSLPLQCEDFCASSICNAYPTAECSVTNCGSCNVLFTVQDQPVDCELCPNGNTWQQCSSAACSETVCIAVEAAICKADPCNNCQVGFYHPTTNNKLSESECNPSKPGTCRPPMGFGICISMCTNDRDCQGSQKCCSNGCGRTCQAPAPRIAFCPNGQRQRTCGTFECSIARCPAYPNAVCRQNSCNYCRAEFYLNGRRLSDAACRPRVKPGTCPTYSLDYGLYSYNLCSPRCSNDGDCAGKMKCCYSFTCSASVCRRPIGTAPPTLFPPTYFPPTFYPPHGKPGRCPAVQGGMGICIHDCISDSDCQGTRKCCSTGCGRTCKLPETGGCQIQCFVDPCTVETCPGAGRGARCESTCCVSKWFRRNGAPFDKRFCNY